MSRPRIKLTQELADSICERIADGKSLRRIAKEKGMPRISTIMNWVRDTPWFMAQYARAKEEQADRYADELVDLARRANSENAHAIRVKADIIKWVCAKLLPRKYSDRVAIDVAEAVVLRVDFSRPAPPEPIDITLEPMPSLPAAAGVDLKEGEHE